MKKTIVISIPDGFISTTVPKLQRSFITYTCMGVEQSGRVIMQVEYEPEEEGHIQWIIEQIKKGEQAEAELVQQMNTFFRLLFEELKNK